MDLARLGAYVWRGLKGGLGLGAEWPSRNPPREPSCNTPSHGNGAGLPPGGVGGFSVHARDGSRLGKPSASEGRGYLEGKRDQFLPMFQS